MGAHRDGSRHGRRRQLRRQVQRRRRRERRAVIAALVAVALVGLVIITPLGAGEDDGGSRTSAEGTGAPAATALSRARDHRPRADRAIDEVLGYTEFLRAGTARQREVALTFDDGPGAYTRDILKILRRHDAPATFFISGYMLESFPALPRKISRQGHAIGNHGADHMRMGDQPREVQEEQIDAVDEGLAKLGVETRLFRPPYGSFNAETLDLLGERGTLMVLWSVDTGDYENPGSDEIVRRALEGVGPGDVILLHDAGGEREQTLDALPHILEALRERDLRPVTVPELLIDNPPPRYQDLGMAEAVAPPGAGLPD